MPDGRAEGVVGELLKSWWPSESRERGEEPGWEAVTFLKGQAPSGPTLTRPHLLTASHLEHLVTFQRPRWWVPEALGGHLAVKYRTPSVFGLCVSHAQTHPTFTNLLRSSYSSEHGLLTSWVFPGQINVWASSDVVGKIRAHWGWAWSSSSGAWGK